MRTLTRAELLALEEVIKYMHDAEERHYEECTDQEKKEHIFQSVLKLKPVLEEEGMWE
jgi:hypothetical protein